ncbi:MAG: FtsX-like permease family protein [Sporolactobacillus sp.]
MQKMIVKQTLREIRKSLNRLIAIIAIVAIGTAFYTGLNAVGPDMISSLTNYYRATQFMDAKLVSTIGFNHDDLKQIRKLSQVEGTLPAYSLDAIQSFGIHGHQTSNVAHLISIPKKEGQAAADDINQLTVLHGRLPNTSDEAVVDDQKGSSGPKIGEIVTVSSGTDEAITSKLHATHFKIVGIVRTPVYLTRDRGSSKIGNGKVSGLLFIPEQTFHLPAYTEVYTTIKGADNLPAFSTDYSAKSDSFDKQLDALSKKRTEARYQEMVTRANEKLDKKQSDYDKAKKKQQQALAQAKSKFAATQKQLALAQQQLNIARTDNDTRLLQSQQKLDAANKRLTEKKKVYEAQSAQLSKAQLDAQSKQMEAQQQIAHLQQQQQQISDQLAELQRARASANSYPAQLDNQIAQAQQAIAQLGAKQAAIQQQLDTQQNQLSSSEKQLKTARAQIDDAANQLREQKQQLTEAETKANSQFAAKQRQITQSQQQLDQSEKQSNTKEKQAEQALAAMKKRLTASKNKISLIKKPKWHIINRADTIGYSNYQGSTERTQGLADILPAFFFMIAALVVLTTMTRMIDEQRTQIGMLKALGYRNFTVAAKYLAYAVVASVIGSLIGIAIGFTLLPKAMAGAYQSLYAMPPMTLHFYSSYAILALVLVSFVTTFAAYLTCAKTLGKVPSELMRPQAPKAGKRILLETISFLWKHLSFSQKVTARNLFRYKKRFWMTVLGVTGCTALLLAGLGLKDSISTQVSQRQFKQLWTYDMTVQSNGTSSSSTAKTIEKAIKSNAKVASETPLMAKSVTLKISGQDEQVSMMIPSNPKQFASYIHLKNPRNGRNFSLPTQGAVLSEKLATMLHVKKGGTVHINGATLKVTGITENYLNHFIYLSPQSYQNAYKDKAKINQYLVKFNHSSKMSASTLSSALMATKGVTSVQLVSDNISQFNDIVSSLNSVIGVIIFSASLLAFVVLYTLTTITISERFSEIATIKVLGFYDKEVSRYVSRESYILTLLGVILGLVIGVFLHSYILNGVEVDQVMFVKHILPQSYAISAVMAFLFTWIVNQLALRRVKKINMIEALKESD